LDHIYCSI